MTFKFSKENIMFTNLFQFDFMYLSFCENIYNVVTKKSILKVNKTGNHTQ